MPKGSKRLAAEKYAKIAVKEAERAKNSNTFGVGGLLVDSRGTIWKSIGNRVLKSGSVHDPTAHVERQLVDWYYSKKKKMMKDLPPASKMTIFVSLDPCVMCSGAILAAGFNVIHISQDNQAGVSCRGFDFPTLPASLRQQAMETFSAVGIAGKRPFSGPSGSIFFGDEINSELDERSTHAFSSSLKTIKRIIRNHHDAYIRGDLINPMTLAKNTKSGSPLRIAKLLKRYNPRVFSEEYSATACLDKSSTGLGHILIQKAKESFKAAGVFNSACLIDPFGNVLLVQGSAENKSPIRTPLLELVRKYHQLLFEAGSEGRKYFAHLKYCKTVLLLGPGKDPKSLMEIGCFGASIEGELSKGDHDNSSNQILQYVIPQQDPGGLQNMLDNLPPLYSRTMQIGDAISEIKDAKLKDFCTKAAPEHCH